MQEGRDDTATNGGAHNETGKNPDSGDGIDTGCRFDRLRGARRPDARHGPRAAASRPDRGRGPAIGEVVYANVFQGLTRIDADGKVQPDLAKSWDDLRRRHGLHVPPAVRRKVAGRQRLQRRRREILARPGRGANPSILRNSSSPTSRRHVVDPNTTVKVTLDQPQGDFVYDMGRRQAVIVSPKSEPTRTRKSRSARDPSSSITGPRAPRSRWLRTPTTGARRPYLDKVTFRFIPDAAAAVPALLSGDVQAFPEHAGRRCTAADQGRSALQGRHRLDGRRNDPRRSTTAGSPSTI